MLFGGAFQVPFAGNYTGKIPIKKTTPERWPHHSKVGLHLFVSPVVAGGIEDFLYQEPHKGSLAIMPSQIVVTGMESGVGVCSIIRFLRGGCWDGKFGLISGFSRY